MNRRCIFWLVCGLVLCPSIASAHEARESSISLQVEPDGLELVVTLSLPAAADLLGKKDGAGLRADTFDSGVAGFTFVVIAADNGDPGRDDTFSLALSNGYQASGTLGGGNVQLPVTPPNSPSLSSNPATTNPTRSR